MTAKIFKVPRALYEHATGKLKEFIDNRTPNQRFYISMGMMLILIVLCFILLLWTDRANEYDMPTIQPVELIKP